MGFVQPQKYATATCEIEILEITLVVDNVWSHLGMHSQNSRPHPKKKTKTTQHRERTTQGDNGGRGKGLDPDHPRKEVSKRTSAKRLDAMQEAKQTRMRKHHCSNNTVHTARMCRSWLLSGPVHAGRVSRFARKFAGKSFDVAGNAV